MAIHTPGPAPRKKKGFFSTEHLSPEAVAAFADQELSESALHRARVHVVLCEECRAEVNHQRAAAEHLRCCNADDSVRAPRSLVQKLAEMPENSLHEQPRSLRPVSELVEVAYRALWGRDSGGKL
ncbi:hypothetical protein [Corynebacterium lipophiloflavum]|uniref:Zinc-finger domain-containing protein n=1 Tax=Corynebacterium lipophiloflavum (strain ATCC 700352 / DSM 44291 / CCUG 37336 / JCM 10383 / DMMZ 1944) TaxID=525263 RepID=C0XQL2_CORLD|nr:hypothetical protein [Corynebacterium lipophiloflavum]EEI17426.1 hypothetical protein HMPREF0298_0732 [Corynebacterium lipophiloflavum DSM 44291]